MKGSQINQALRLGAQHALFNHEGKWYHQLIRFPGILIDNNGYILFPSRLDYLNNTSIKRNKDVHIKGGIAGLPSYRFFTSMQKQQIAHILKENLNLLVQSGNQAFFFVPSASYEVIVVTRAGPKPNAPTEVKNIHRKICKELYMVLSRKYGSSNLSCECSSGSGTSIDLVRRTSDGYIFYEVKTYEDLRTSIREATGQLLEYAYWTSNDPIELVIVSHKSPDKAAAAYLSRLRKKFKIPIFYQHMNLDKGLLSRRF